jgi:hypothetical protein
MTPDRLQQFEDLNHSAPGSIPIAQFCSLLSGDGARLTAHRQARLGSRQGLAVAGVRS